VRVSCARTVRARALATSHFMVGPGAWFRRVHVAPLAEHYYFWSRFKVRMSRRLATKHKDDSMERSTLALVTALSLAACGEAPSSASETAKLTRDSTAASEPSMTVVPNDDLLDGQEVEVTLSGFPANTQVIIGECVGHLALGSQCGGVWQFVTTNAEGVFQGHVRVKRYFEPLSYAYTVSCAEPGSCVLGTVIDAGVFEVPLYFRDVPILKGTLRVEPSAVDPGEFVTVTGSGWSPGAVVQTSFTATRGGTNDYTQAQQVVADDTGSFATSLPASAMQGYVDYDDYIVDQTYVDCTAASDACGILALDTREPETTQVRVPVAVRPTGAAAGGATLDLESPLVDALVVRLRGSGWGQNQVLRAWQCKGASFEGCAYVQDQFGPITLYTGETGSFRAYPRLHARMFERGALVDCIDEPGCTLVIADPNALQATAVRVPLPYVRGDQFEVTSRYSAGEETWFQDGLELTGNSESDFQQTSAKRTLWLLALAGASSGGKRPNTGPHSHTSTYSYVDYLATSEQAARFDYTAVEIQKVGSLFWSWFIQGLPQPGP